MHNVDCAFASDAVAKIAATKVPVFSICRILLQMQFSIVVEIQNAALSGESWDPELCVFWASALAGVSGRRMGCVWGKSLTRPGSAGPGHPLP
jgi:hypothetical protein